MFIKRVCLANQNADMVSYISDVESCPASEWSVMGTRLSKKIWNQCLMSWRKWRRFLKMMKKGNKLFLKTYLPWKKRKKKILCMEPLSMAKNKLQYKKPKIDTKVLSNNAIHYSVILLFPFSNSYLDNTFVCSSICLHFKSFKYIFMLAYNPYVAPKQN